MAGSKKPCPGCGEVVLGRKASDVCCDCKRLLSKAKFMEEQLAILPDEIGVRIGSAAHYNEYVRSRSGVGRSIMDDFYRVVVAGSRRSEDEASIFWRPGEFCVLGKIDTGGAAKVIMNKELAHAIRDLNTAVRDGLEAEYEKGKSDGHNLLVRLASGDLSVDKFFRETEG